MLDLLPDVGVKSGSIPSFPIGVFVLSTGHSFLANASDPSGGFLKPVYTVVLQIALLPLVPIAEKSFTDDVLTTCIVGGVVLRAESSGGR